MLLREMRNRLGRTVMTILAVAAATGLLISMLSVAEGVRLAVTNEIERSRQDLLVTTTGGTAIEQGHRVAEELAALPGVAAAMPTQWAVNPALLFNTTTGAFGSAFGVGVEPQRLQQFLDASDTFNVFGIPINFTEGQWFAVPDDPHYADGRYDGNWTDEILVSRQFLTDLGVDLGETLRLSRAANLPGREMRVMGYFDLPFLESALFKPYAVLVHLSEMQSLLGVDRIENRTVDAIDAISIQLTQEYRTDPALVRALQADLRERYPYFQVISRQDQLDYVQDSSGVGQGFYTALGSVALVIGLLFLATVMIMNVAERTNEIGIKRAIGLSKRTIFQQVFMEAILILLFGGAIGVVFGNFGSDLLGDYVSRSFGIRADLTAITPSLVLTSFIEVLALGAIFAFYPAWKGARMRVVEALQYVG